MSKGTIGSEANFSSGQAQPPSIAEHTPTPWRVSKCSTYYVLSKDERIVAVADYGGGIAIETAKANAARIVLAVNNFDALVEALTAAQKALRVARNLIDAHENWRLAQEPKFLAEQALRQISDALQRAQGNIEKNEDQPSS